MKHLAEWHATQPGKVTEGDILSMATDLSKGHVSPKMLKVLLQREDWWVYREEIAMDELLQVRKKLESRTGEYAEAHYEALQAAKRNIRENPKLVADIAGPMIDRVWAKKEGSVGAQQTIILNIGGQGSVKEVLHYEALPVEIVESTSTEAG